MARLTAEHFAALEGAIINATEKLEDMTELVRLGTDDYSQEDVDAKEKQVCLAEEALEIMRSEGGT